MLLSSLEGLSYHFYRCSSNISERIRQLKYLVYWTIHNVVMCRQGGARKRKGPLKGTKGRERFRTEEAFYTNPIPDCLCRQQVSANTTTALLPNSQSGIGYMPKKESHTTEIDTGLRQAGGQDSSSQQKYTRWQVSFFIHVPCKMCAVATNPVPYTPTYNACTTNTPGVQQFHPWVIPEVCVEASPVCDILLT